MKRKPRVHSRPATTRPRGRKQSVKELEERFAILLMLLQHNIEKLLRHTSRRTARR